MRGPNTLEDDCQFIHKKVVAKEIQLERSLEAQLTEILTKKQFSSFLSKLGKVNIFAPAWRRGWKSN